MTRLTAAMTPSAEEKRKNIISADVRNIIGIDSCSKRSDVFTARKSFFYTHGYTADKFVDRVLKAFPDAIILDSGEVWKPFRGGASIAKQSHWFVKFTFSK